MAWWRTLTTEEQELAIREQGKLFAPGSPGWERFGAKWDSAAAAGTEFGLNAAQVLAARRQDMPLRQYASLTGVTSIDEYNQFTEDEDVLRRALAELRFEATKAELKGGS